MLGSRTDLHIFDAGSVNGTRYCNEILLPYVRLFRGAIFMDDNAPCHPTVAAEQLLESEDIERMDWPTRSPDLNPIEHVWDFLGRRLAARTLPPVTIRELRLALQDEWAAMPQQLIDTLILIMGRRWGLFETNDNQQDLAFRKAIEMINTDESKLPRTKLQARVKSVAPQDSFRALKTGNAKNDSIGKRDKRSF
ncbi:transposable element Tcb2 transposase [Trichonephila clavipes]|nr:transposable element Tcb2 transposase [Trichonephila clavipes]